MLNKEVTEIDARNAPGRFRDAWFLRQVGPLSFFVLIFFINFCGRMIFAPLLPSIEKELGITHGRAGSFFFLMSAGYVLGLLGSGFLAARITHKITITISAIGVGLALLGLSFANSLWMISTVLMMLGFTAGLYIPSAIAAITARVDRPRWGTAIAIHELAPNLAFFAAPFIAEAFLKSSSWRTALAALGSASLLTGVAYFRFAKSGEFRGAAPGSNASLLFRTPSFWLMLMLFGLGVSTTIGVYAMLPLYLVSERHVEQSWANTIVALSRSHGPVMGFLGGIVSDRLGPKRTIVISLTCTGIATLLLGPVPIGWLNGVVFLQPLLAVWFFPAAFAAVALITPPAARNLAVSFTVPAGYILGGGAVPTFIGTMGDAGSFATGYVVTGLLILSGGALALLLRLPEN